MTRKSANKTTRQDSSTDQGLNRLYTAHQVHTLAQLLYRELAMRTQAAGWNPQAPFASAPTHDVPQDAQGADGQRRTALPMKDSPAARAMSVGRIRRRTRLRLTRWPRSSSSSRIRRLP